MSIISPRDEELVDWFDACDPNPHVRPVPGYERIPIWLLGSGASIARNWRRSSACRLPSPRTSRRICCSSALHLYRSNFKTFGAAGKPYAMVCINIIAADSNRDAEFLFTSMQQAFVKLRRGETGRLPPPVENMHQLWSASEQWRAAGTEHVAGRR